MSVKAMTWVFEHSPYKLADRLVHLALADVANDDHDNQLWLTRERVAFKAQVSEATVKRALAKMVDDGYLEKIAEGGGRGRPSEYRLLFPKPGQNDPVPEPGHPEPETGSSCRETGSSTEPVPLTNSIELKEPKLSRVDQRFEAIWQVYPRKVNKSGARNAFRARVNAGTPLDFLETATRHYGESVRGCEERFILHGATFFGPNDRWRDYLEAPRPQQPARSQNGRRDGIDMTFEQICAEYTRKGGT